MNRDQQAAKATDRGNGNRSMEAKWRTEIDLSLHHMTASIEFRKPESRRQPECVGLEVAQPIPVAKSNFRKGSDALPGVVANQQVGPTFSEIAFGNHSLAPKTK